MSKESKIKNKNMYINKNIAISESGFIFDPSTGDSYSTNPIGKDIISLVQEGKSKKDIIDFLLHKYEVDLSTIEKDLNDFLYLLQINHVLKDE